ncbi:tol-Pal system TolQ [Asticcacaulis biprosthecium C19]|uniref:Tol-Pal system TolQ n=1 Tax=Asticcacaulis biprosthecium C19 TaxID=715226 RepID=F4QRD4_9CAUL|nr:MotA/TolQ/ExbB proton channel family protein [Asticcacaulis biprosthecium]EGF90771.1 tol-Pal system TolQ [Asticcacaulis biprosthecium C19]
MKRDGLMTIAGAFLDAALPLQILMGLLVLSMVFAVVTAVVKVRQRDLSGGSSLVAALRWAAPLAGVAGAAYTGFFSFARISADQIVPVVAIAPGMAEAALSLVLGLISGVTAIVATAVINAHIDRRVLGA